jgi:Domain of unknown function (DUF1905)/Bacteriocin-protection, YdeI or OmpD-Associated
MGDEDMRFRAKVIPSGNATGIEIPVKVVQGLAAGARPPIVVTINGHTWRTRVARMRGQILVGISRANRAAAGIAEGEEVEVELTLDEEPRVVPEPPDLAEALNAHPEARAVFDRLPYGLKRKQVAEIEEAATPEVRQRRMARLVTTLQSDRTRRPPGRKSGAQGRKASTKRPGQGGRRVRPRWPALPAPSIRVLESPRLSRRSGAQPPRRSP